MRVFDINPNTSPKTWGEFWRQTRERRTVLGESIHRRKDGSLFPVDISSTFIEFDEREYLCGFARDIAERKQLEAARENLILELQEALAKVKTLSGLLPICAKCKKIRDDKGYWNQIEVYVREHSQAEFSHGICPECARILYSDFAD